MENITRLLHCGSRFLSSVSIATVPCCCVDAGIERIALPVMARVLRRGSSASCGGSARMSFSLTSGQQRGSTPVHALHNHKTRPSWETAIQTTKTRHVVTAATPRLAAPRGRPRASSPSAVADEDFAPDQNGLAPIGCGRRLPGGRRLPALGPRFCLPPRPIRCRRFRFRVRRALWPQCNLGVRLLGGGERFRCAALAGLGSVAGRVQIACR